MVYENNIDVEMKLDGVGEADKDPSNTVRNVETSVNIYSHCCCHITL